MNSSMNAQEDCTAHLNIVRVDAETMLEMIKNNRTGTLMPATITPNCAGVPIIELKAGDFLFTKS